MALTPFTLFGPAHVATLILIAAAAFGVVRRAPGWPSKWKRPIDLCLAAVIGAFIVASYARLELIGGFRVAISLPLHLCDLTIGACLLALLTRQRLAVEVCYYWALTGAVGALLTPDLRSGFPSVLFLLFFVGHALLVLTVAWLVGSGTPPGKGSAIRAFVALNIYLAVMGPIDWLFGWNYGYLCRKPFGPSALDYLGPWPWYLTSVEAIAAVSFALLSLPWRRAK